MKLESCNNNLESDLLFSSIINPSTLGNEISVIVVDDDHGASVSSPSSAKLLVAGGGDAMAVEEDSAMVGSEKTREKVIGLLHIHASINMGSKL